MGKATERAVSIDVWESSECLTRYSVSLCGGDGDEIRCLGGHDDEDAAWALACERADELGVPARCLYGETGTVSREYEPDIRLSCPRCEREIDDDETPCDAGGGICADCCEADQGCPCGHGHTEDEGVSL